MKCYLSYKADYFDYVVKEPTDAFRSSETKFCNPYSCKALLAHSSPAHVNKAMWNWVLNIWCKM